VRRDFSDDHEVPGVGNLGDDVAVEVEVGKTL